MDGEEESYSAGLEGEHPYIQQRLYDVIDINEVDDSEGENDEDFVVDARVSESGSPRAELNLREGSVREEEEIVAGKSLPSDDNLESGSQDSQWGGPESYGLCCSICMEPWTSGGEHHISCLPCGHLFGMSCINRWIKHKRSSSKCPQCNRTCKMKDVRKLFAPTIAAVNEGSQKRIRTLEEKCAALERQEYEWRKKETQWKEMHISLLNQVDSLAERARHLEGIIETFPRRNHQFSAFDEPHEVARPEYCFKSQAKSIRLCYFNLLAELEVDNARLFDITSSGRLLLARRAKSSGKHILTELTLQFPNERDDIVLPETVKFVKDLRISPLDGSLALCASLGKRLLILSLNDKSVVLSYDLPAPTWSCCWDINNPNYIYAGMQNGVLNVFDVRRSAGAVDSFSTNSVNPIHTIHPVKSESSLPSVLLASSSGVWQWTSGNGERSSWIHEASNEEVCISLAHSPASNDVVASFRPRAEVSADGILTQQSATPLASKGVIGFHHYLRRQDGVYKKHGAAQSTVSDVRLPRTVLIDGENRPPLFAAGNDELALRELPSFAYAQRLRAHRSFICDVRYNDGVLGSLSEDRVLIYR